MAYALDKGPLLLKRGSQEWEPSCWQGENVIVFEAVDDLVHHLEHAIDWSA
jgi:hypothetical protein